MLSPSESVPYMESPSTEVISITTFITNQAKKTVAAICSTQIKIFAATLRLRLLLRPFWYSISNSIHTPPFPENSPIFIIPVSGNISNIFSVITNGTAKSPPSRFQYPNAP